MRSVACLAVFGVLLLSSVSALESISTEQALDILDTLKSSPVRLGARHDAAGRLSPSNDRSYLPWLPPDLTPSFPRRDDGMT